MPETHARGTIASCDRSRSLSEVPYRPHDTSTRQTKTFEQNNAASQRASRRAQPGCRSNDCKGRRPKTTAVPDENPSTQRIRNAEKSNRPETFAKNKAQ